MIKVCGHRVLVKPDPITTETSWGFQTISSDRERKLEQSAQIWGTVVQIGPTAYADPGLGGYPWCGIGDRVAYAKYGGKAILDEDTGAEYILLNDEDIVAVDEKETINE